MSLHIRKVLILVLIGGACLVGYLVREFNRPTKATLNAVSAPSVPNLNPYRSRVTFDDSGFLAAMATLEPWRDPTSLEEIASAFSRLGYRGIKKIDDSLLQLTEAANQPIDPKLNENRVIDAHLHKAALFLYEGEPRQAYRQLQQTRKLVELSESMAHQWRYTIIFLQGVAGLRCGETENCIDCRGQGACIFPIRATAIHKNPEGSRLAVEHFQEYLKQFPDDLGVRWLLNVAHMTLGEHSQMVSEFRISFDQFGSEFDIGRFKDIGHLVGLNRFNQSGGAIMDDFDNDGLLDVVVTSYDPAQAMAFYRNKGDGTFEDRTQAAGLEKQLGGLNLVQCDYNNDGFLDIFIVRGAWMHHPMRPSLLRNNGNGTFTDVTAQAGLMDPLNSICASWADYDQDGFVDLFICNETGPNRLYRNRGDGTFEEMAAKAGVDGKQLHCKGAAWLDYDNDGFPDLFVNYLGGTPQMFHNNKGGTFTDKALELGITAPKVGFSCWAFDYDNDGWQDIFATSFERSLEDVVRGIQGEPVGNGKEVTRLYRNVEGKKFQDVSKEVGVDKVFATMGSNFADFDNDGFLDFYLSTGEPLLSTLVPNRMFKNVAGKRFADITTTSGTGHLQKGHGVACGDWDRDGSVDLFVELGGATPGDRYHNALFQNPGQGNNWLTVKLIGTKTNRAAIGARIKVVTAGDKPLTIHRHVSSGSSFGANPLQQTIGLGKTKSVVTLEIYWPTSRTTQVFHDVAVDQAIEITENAEEYRKRKWTRVPVPSE